MNTENTWLVNLARNQNSLVVVALLQNSGTRLPHLMNTSGFHQNVDEGHKSFNCNVNGIRGSKMPLELMV